MGESKKMFDEVLKLESSFFYSCLEKIGEGLFNAEKNFYEDYISKEEFLQMLYDKSDKNLEFLARKSKLLTDRFFGKTILLYAPLYISNYCINKCLYCGFSALNENVIRKKLSRQEIIYEMEVLRNKGFDSILILTGDDRRNSPLEYIGETVKLARKYFSEVLVEIYALSVEEYKYLVDIGLTGVTIYQETYDELLYDKLHLSGPKKDFKFRLLSAERAIIAGVKQVSIGPLLGLNKNFWYDVYMAAIHASYLQSTYPEIEVSISFPRIQPSEANMKVEYSVDDKSFVRIICATRVFLPRVGINISTRELPYMRDNLIGLGITKMSAGSKTTVGGYANVSEDTGQFEISDTREVDEIIKVLYQKGYRPEFTNWVKV